MKKTMVMIAALMVMMSTLVYAGGDQNCGDKGQGTTGSSVPGTAKQNRAPGS
ncbi:MAG: hypothetical protein KKF30_10170 [Proteobacteria bacterium]|nr:hypothetical protein [Pseudomonadota bacterium]MBU4468907.1 hypothetical protein [Pseudomonadota bacterium]MCG2750900.1 hypothetical protein [Desulfobacteraceae bacterium]